MKMKKSICLLMAMLMACFALTGCGGGEKKADTGKKGSEKILVTEAFHSLLYLPLYVANDKGFFKEAGIDVSSIRSAGSGPAALSAVLSGEAAFSVHGPEHVAFAKEKGGEARALSAVANGAPVWVLAKEGIDIKSVADFKGKSIITGLAPSTHNTLFRKLMLDNKFEIGKDVTITEVQNNSELGPVLAGKADIAVVYEPVASSGINQKLHIVHDFTKDYPEFAFSTVNTSLKLIKEKPELVKSFVGAMDKALDYIHKNPQDAKEIAKKEFPNMDAKVVEMAVQRMIDSNIYLPSGKVTEKAYQNAMDIQKFIGHLKKDIPYGEMVDASFTK